MPDAQRIAIGQRWRSNVSDQVVEITDISRESVSDDTIYIQSVDGDYAGSMPKWNFLMLYRGMY